MFTIKNKRLLKNGEPVPLVTGDPEQIEFMQRLNKLADRIKNGVPELPHCICGVMLNGINKSMCCPNCNTEYTYSAITNLFTIKSRPKFL